MFLTTYPRNLQLFSHFLLNTYVMTFNITLLKYVAYMILTKIGKLFPLPFYANKLQALHNSTFKHIFLD